MFDRKIISKKVEGYYKVGIYYRHCYVCNKICNIADDKKNQENWYSVDLDKDALMEKYNPTSGTCPKCTEPIQERINFLKNKQKGKKKGAS